MINKLYKTILKIAFIFVATLMLNISFAQINVYTPNASGGPTDNFIKKVILPSIKKLNGVEHSFYKATTDIESLVTEVKRNPNSILIMTEANVVRFEKLYNSKITEHLNINSVLAISPVVLFKSARSRLNFDSLVNKDVRIGYVDGLSSERCAIQMKNEYGEKMQLISLKNEAELMSEMIEKNIDGYCTSSLILVTQNMQAGHLIPIAASSKIFFSPYNNLNRNFPDGKLITARSFIAIFSNTKSVEADVLAKKLSIHIQKDMDSITSLNKIYLQPIISEE